MKEFYHYHVIIGGLLVYFKHYRWLRHIMHFSQESPAHFALVPGTLSKVFMEARYVDQLLSKPFSVYQKYQFYGLERGARMDDAIVGFIYQYLALLIIRIWTYKDYNYNYTNPLEIPMADDESIEANDDMIICVEQIKKNVSRWYENGLIKDFGLKDVAQDEIIKKLDAYIIVLKMKIQEISNREDVDPYKARVIRDEMIVANANTPSLIPMKKDGECVDESLYNIVSTPVHVVQSIEKPYITKGSLKSMGNFGTCLVTALNNAILNDYLTICFQHMSKTISYSINQRDLLKAIDKLCLAEGYAIVEMGNALDLYELKKNLSYIDNERAYNGRRIINLGLSRFSPCLWVVKESEIPFMEILETGSTGGDLSEIDATNHLYSNIVNLQKPYNVSLIQTIKVYVLKNFSKTCLLNVMYNYGSDTYDLEKVGSLE